MSNMSEFSGKLITFEGGDGAGKTTQAKLLAHKLAASGADVVEVREPGGTYLGERLRNILLDPESKICAHAEALIYEASRAQLICETIRPALEAGKVVICDRFTDSTVAYQGIGRGIDESQISLLNDFATSGITPDATILLKCSYQETSTRRSERGDSDRIELEGDGFLQRVNSAFEKLGSSANINTDAGEKSTSNDPARIRVVDADGTPEEVAARIDQALSDIFSQIGAVE